jgi:hypothetical protein
LFFVYMPTIVFIKVSGTVEDTLRFNISCKISIRRQILFYFFKICICVHNSVFDIKTFKAKLGLLENQRSCATLFTSCTWIP